MRIWTSLAIELGLALVCGLSALVGRGFLDALYGLLGPIMVWEFIEAFFVIYLIDLRHRGSLLSWAFVLSVAVIVLIYAAAVDGWVLFWFALLTGRHLLARRAGLLRSATANLVHYVFAVFPAGLAANLATNAFDIGFNRGVVLFAAFYFAMRALFLRWDPHKWLGIRWEVGK